MNQMYNMEAPMMPCRMMPKSNPNEVGSVSKPKTNEDASVPKSNPNEVGSVSNPVQMHMQMQMMHMHFMMQMCITMHMNTMQMMDKMTKK